MVFLQVGFRETEPHELRDQAAFVAARSARETSLAGERKGIGVAVRDHRARLGTVDCLIRVARRSE